MLARNSLQILLQQVQPERENWICSLSTHIEFWLAGQVIIQYDDVLSTFWLLSQKNASTPSNFTTDFNTEFNMADFYYYYEGFIPASSQYRLKIWEDIISSYRLIT